jgi:hypothetical protein
MALKRLGNSIKNWKQGVFEAGFFASHFSLFQLLKCCTSQDKLSLNPEFAAAICCGL